MDDIVKRIRQQSYFGPEPYEAANEIEQLRQRVQELTAERDKAHQYWQIAEGRCDALMRDKNYLLLNAEVAMKCIGDMGPSKPAVKAYSILQEAIASVKEKA